CSFLHRCLAGHTLFPYTTLFRSNAAQVAHSVVDAADKPSRFTSTPILADRLSIGTRSCLVVSRWRTVTALSVSVSKSTVMQNGVDRKSTRLNSSHGSISYAVFCL